MKENPNIEEIYSLNAFYQPLLNQAVGTYVQEVDFAMLRDGMFLTTAV